MTKPMQIPQITSQLTTDLPQRDFHIGDMAMLQQAVSSMMYSTPAASCVRELLCNGRDAQRELRRLQQSRPDLSAFDTYRPIEITLPGRNNYLIFTDHGIGIDDLRMEQHFAGYCASTKRDSNDETGGFGLGCKTPYAITDQFVVTSITADPSGRRTRRSWSCFRNAVGCSSFVKLYEVDTEEGPGTSIIVPCPPKYAEEARQAAALIAYWWVASDVGVTISGIQAPVKDSDGDGEEEEEEGDRPVLTPITDRVSILSTSKTTVPTVKGKTGLVVLLDGVPYATEVPAFKCYGGIPVVHLNTGEARPVISREVLDSSADVIIAGHLADAMDKCLEGVTSIQEAIRRSARHKVCLPFSEETSPQGRNVHWNGALEVLLSDEFRIRRLEKRDGVMTGWAGRYSRDITLSEDYGLTWQIVYSNTLDAKTRARVWQWLKGHPTLQMVLLVARSKSFRKPMSEVCGAWLTAVGVPMSSLPPLEGAPPRGTQRWWHYREEGSKALLGGPIGGCDPSEAAAVPYLIRSGKGMVWFFGESVKDTHPTQWTYDEGGRVIPLQAIRIVSNTALIPDGWVPLERVYMDFLRSEEQWMKASGLRYFPSGLLQSYRLSPLKLGEKNGFRDAIEWLEKLRNYNEHRVRIENYRFLRSMLPYPVRNSLYRVPEMKYPTDHRLSSKEPWDILMERYTCHDYEI